MNAPSFLVVLISFAVLMYWYMVNLKEAKNGSVGLFRMKHDKDVVVPGKAKVKKIKDPLKNRAAAERLRERVKESGALAGSILAAKAAKAVDAHQQSEVESASAAEKIVPATVLKSGKSYRFKKATKEVIQIEPTDDENRLRRRLAGKAHKTRNRDSDQPIEPKVDQDFFDGTT